MLHFIFQWVLTLNVGELLEVLKHLPLDMEVVLAEDPEGNGFSLLMELDHEAMVENQDVVILWPGIKVEPEWLDDDG